jgi:hypothetical protein
MDNNRDIIFYDFLVGWLHQEKKKLSADFRLVFSASGAGRAPLTSEQHH